MIQHKTLITALAVMMLGLAGCGGQQTTKPSTSGEAQGTEGAQPSGTPGGAAPGAEAVPEGGAAAATEAQLMKRVHFAFDSSAIDDANRAIVEANAKYLSAHPDAKVKLEGNTDERGTREYNLALGERRAQSVERMLKALGISGNRISTVSYGKERPVSQGHGEAAWAQNRRVDFVYSP